MPTHGNREPKNRFVAAMLAFFLGGVGFHKFYLNHPMAGVMYLIGFVLCASTLILMWIPPLCALVECIILLAMSDERFHDTYG